MISRWCGLWVKLIDGNMIHVGNGSGVFKIRSASSGTCICPHISWISFYNLQSWLLLSISSDSIFTVQYHVTVCHPVTQWVTAPNGLSVRSQRPPATQSGPTCRRCWPWWSLTTSPSAPPSTTATAGATGRRGGPTPRPWAPPPASVWTRTWPTFWPSCRMSLGSSACELLCLFF